jgi:hypothetical protein
VPERVSVIAGWIGGSSGATLRFAGRSLRQVWTGETPEGLRLERSLLPGNRWTSVDLVGDEQIGVVLLNDFVGELPQESQAAGIREAIARAESSNRRLVVRARIEQPSPDVSLTLEVSLP